MNFVRKVAKNPFSVKELLHQEVGGYEQERDAHEVHASDLTREKPLFCPREVVLMRRLDIQKYKQAISFAMRLTFDEGADKQWRINNDYLRAHMVGRWRCTRCDRKSEFQVGPPNSEGYHCLRHNWEYIEPTLTHPVGITGSLDGLVQFVPSKIRMLEVKILKDEFFRKLVGAYAEHRLRTQLYLRMIAEGASFPVKVDSEIGHVVYMMRGFGIKDVEHGFSPIKEYTVERNDAAVERYLEMALAIQKGVDPGQTPRGVCASLLDERAKSCRVKKQCFSGKYPPNVDWE